MLPLSSGKLSITLIDCDGGGGCQLFRSFGAYLQKYTTSHLRRSSYLFSQLLEPQISLR